MAKMSYRLSHFCFAATRHSICDSRIKREEVRWKSSYLFSFYDLKLLYLLRATSCSWRSGTLRCSWFRAYVAA